MPITPHRRQWHQRPWLLLSSLPLLLLLTMGAAGVDALHADRAGKEDWMRRHVGRVTKAVHTVR
jgi:hypothetical protein